MSSGYEQVSEIETWELRMLREKAHKWDKHVLEAGQSPVRDGEVAVSRETAVRLHEFTGMSEDLDEETERAHFALRAAIWPRGRRAMTVDVSKAANAVAYAGMARCDQVEKPIRGELEKIGYGYAALVAEAEARGWTVTLESQWHIMIWKQTPKPYAKADNVYDPERGELIGSWLDGPNWSVDHLARCLRAEMAVLCTWPAGWETHRLAEALARASDPDREGGDEK